MNRSFQRKLTYLALIAALLVPVSMIGRPAANAPDSGQETGGGKLAELREEYKLGQAQIGKIDPTTSAVRYLSLGGHGLAVCVLQQKAAEYQKQEEWIKTSAVLQQLTYLQPYYVKVWENQAWNVSYNISSEWDDYREKYYWVLRGFKLLRRGMDYNELEPGFPYWLGWYSGHKFGQSDEKVHFRKLFAADVPNRKFLVPAGEVDAGWAEERDNFLYGRRYLRYAQDMVDKRGAVLRSMAPENFNIQVPMMQSQYAEALEADGLIGPEARAKARAAWRQAQLDWIAYGERDFPSIHGYFVRLDSLKKSEADLKEAQARFEKLAPGLREKVVAEKEAKLSPEQRAALKRPEELRDEKEMRLAYTAQTSIVTEEPEIAERVEPAQREEAKRVAAEVMRLRVLSTEARSLRKIYNYDYWLARSEMEQTDDALLARELFFLAMRDADDKPWEAKKSFEDGFDLWAEILKKYPIMIDDQTAYEITDKIKAYRGVLKQLDLKFDRHNFKLRNLMDQNSMQ